MTEKDAVATAETISAQRMKKVLRIAIAPLMDTGLVMLNALKDGADDGKKTANGMVMEMANKLLELFDAERPIIPDSEADYYIGYNNGLTMAKAIAIKLDAIPVVRCKDCTHYDNDKCICNFHSEEPQIYATFSVDMTPDDFCSYGERKDNGKKKLCVSRKSEDARVTALRSMTLA